MKDLTNSEYILIVGYGRAVQTRSGDEFEAHVLLEWDRFSAETEAGLEDHSPENLP
jgi:hypothetical protein